MRLFKLTMGLIKLVVVVLSLVATSWSEYIVTNMDEIIVKEKKEGGEISFSKKEIEKAQNLYLPDILKYEPEINLVRKASSGDNSDILSIRGLSRNRILLNLNGRSLNAAGVVGGYYNDFSIIPIDNIEKIQIIKGGGDLKYGNNALGGVINIVTKEPTEKLNISLFSGFSAGSKIDYIFNERFNISKKHNRFGYVISGSYQNNDEYLWNNHFKAKNLGGIFSYNITDYSKLTAAIQYTNTNRGFIRNNRRSSDPTNPAFYQRYNDDYPLSFGDTLSPYSGNVSQPGPGAYWIKEKTLLDLGYRSIFKEWFYEVKLYKNIENRFEYNYSSHITSPTYPNPDGTLVFKRKIESDRSWGANIDTNKEFEKHTINAGLEYKKLAYGEIKVLYVDTSYGCSGLACTGTKPSSSSDAYGLYIKDEYSISDKTRLISGIRYDRYKVNRENDNSQIKELAQNLLNLSFGFRYNPSQTHELSLALYTKYRTPTIPEVWWWANNQFGYTKDLKSERNNAVEFGYKLKWGRSIYEVAAYAYDIKDYIMSRFDPTKRGVYNIDSVKLYGGSIKYYAHYKTIKPYLSLTFQKTKKGYDIYDPAKLTDELDYTPRFKLTAGIEKHITDRLSFQANYRYSDLSHTVYSWRVGNTSKYKLITIKPYDVVDVELKYNLKNFTASLYADNLFNERYEERFGYPMNGRVIGGSLSYRF